ncbi:MAG: adenylyl-sulfate kinase [Sulfuriferula sp.]
MRDLISPYGAEVITTFMASDADTHELHRIASRLPNVKLNAYQHSDLMLLLTGAYTPLTGYMGQADYVSVLENMRLHTGLTWVHPLTLAIPLRLAQSLQIGQALALRDAYDELQAVLTVTEIYRSQPALEAEVLGATLAFDTQPLWYVAGTVVAVNASHRYDFVGDYHPPAQLREYFSERGWGRVVAYQTAQPLHRAALEFMLRAAVQNQAGLLIQPLTGGEQHLSSTYYPTIRSYQAVMSRLCKLTTVLSLSPNYPRHGGVREILHRAIISRNYGCSHLVVGGESAAQGATRRGRDVLEGDAFHQVESHIREIGVGLIPYPRMVYVEERAQYLPLEEAPKDTFKLVLTADEIKRRLQADLPIPEWYTFPEVLAEMRVAYPPRQASGFAILMTGVAGTGKTTLASALSQALGAIGKRKVSLLDSDLVAHYPNIADNMDAVTLLTSEVVKHQGIVICAFDMPTIAVRRMMRNAVQHYGGYFEIALTAPVSVCAARVAKKTKVVQAGDNYEIPEQADLAVDTGLLNVAQAMQMIILKLEQEGYI